jgi:hypothetical protein
MKKNKLYLFIILFLILLGSYLIKNRNIQPSSPKINDQSNHVEKEYLSHLKAKKDWMEAISSIYKNPITLYGKVVDQYQKPVPDATVTLYPLTNHFGQDSGNALTLKSDAAGHFSITGLNGYSMGVAVNKDGYLRFPPTSNLSSQENLSYSEGGDGKRYSISSHPLVLELFCVNEAKTLAFVSEKRWKLPVDGSSIFIALDTEKGEGAHQIEFRFMSDRFQLPEQELYTKLYNWSLEVRIQGGGLVWDRSDAEFEAPESGYKDVVRYKYSSDMPRDQWKRLRSGRYFVKFADGTYGRIQFSIDGGSDGMPLYMQSWLSLKPINRNLASEFMTIKVLNSKEVEN